MEKDLNRNFITFEGAEGSGKSTQIALCRQYLLERGKDVVLIREPGGVKISEAVRKILLDVNNTEMNNECETLLYMAARAQLVEEKILPALREGKVVLCDRFLDSTFVYQGFGHGLKLETIQMIGNFATKGLVPGLTLLLDIEVEEGLRRAGSHKDTDRIEQRSISYHQKVRQGYLTLAKSDPERIKVIKVDRCGKEEIFKEVKKHLNQRLGLHD
ncbi:MAG: dTMP kinase [Candidatus Omnitrophota bacterium]